MQTTAVFVELLIAGIQTGVWMILCVMALFGTKWLRCAAAMADGWELLASFLILAVLYSLGVLTDRVSDFLFENTPLTNWFRKCHWTRRIAKRDCDDGRIAVMKAEKQITVFLKYIRDQIRVCRAIMFNTPLTTCAALWFIVEQIPADYRRKAIVTVIVFGSILSVAAFFIHAVLEHTYKKRIRQAKKVINRNS